MKTIWTLLIAVVVSASAAGTGTYYFVNAKATKDKNSLQEQINNLNRRITDSQAALSSASATESLNNVSTADWKTFNDTLLGYAIKYPTDWVVDAVNNPVLFHPSADNFFLSISKTETQSSLTDYVETLKNQAATLTNQGKPGDVFGTQTQTTVDGKTAIKFVNCVQGASAYQYDWYFLKSGMSIYKIAISTVIGQGPAIDANDYIPIAEAMLSTINFTSTVSS
ncbi:MAG: PsbP-related protein [Patescibacteria group bacterium]